MHALQPQYLPNRQNEVNRNLPNRRNTFLTIWQQKRPDYRPGLEVDMKGKFWGVTMRGLFKAGATAVLTGAILCSCQGFDPQVPEPAIYLDGNYRALSECAYANGLRSGGWQMTVMESVPSVEMTAHSENLITARIEVFPDGDNKAKLVGYYMSSLLGRQAGIDAVNSAFRACSSKATQAKTAPE